MASEPAKPEFISIVTTVRNEAAHLARLLESLLVQEGPFEIIIVDSLSRDRTYAIAQEYGVRARSTVRVFRRFGSRGMGRNSGVEAAWGNVVAFIDGDCFADSQWLHAIREGIRSAEVVAGRTVAVGNTRYANLERVELFLRGNDVTYPSCNLAYRKTLFDALGGFDPRFITAEDIDLNLRAVQRGAKIHYTETAVVYHQMRTTPIRFLYQAFWNGYGRKQLTEKHGGLWGSYRVRRLLSGQRSVIAWARLAAALTGYLTRVMTAGKRRIGPAPPVGATLSAPSSSREMFTR